MSNIPIELSDPTDPTDPTNNYKQNFFEANTQEVNEENDPNKVKRLIKSIGSFYSFQLKIIEQINKARTNPKQFASTIQEILQNNFSSEDSCLYINEDKHFFQEGEHGFIEAIEFLNTTPSLNPFIMKDGLNNSTDDLLTQLICNEGTDNYDIQNNILKNIESRMNKYGLALGKLFEIIDYGNHLPELVVMNFIICDGDIERKEREIIFNPQLAFIGVCSGLMPSEKVSTVMCFCNHYFSNGDPIPENIYLEYQGSFNDDVNKNIKLVNKERTGESNSQDSSVMNDEVGNDEFNNIYNGSSGNNGNDIINNNNNNYYNTESVIRVNTGYNNFNSTSNKETEVVYNNVVRKGKEGVIVNMNINTESSNNNYNSEIINTDETAQFLRGRISNYETRNNMNNLNINGDAGNVNINNGMFKTIAYTNTNANPSMFNSNTNNTANNNNTNINAINSNNVKFRQSTFQTNPEFNPLGITPRPSVNKINAINNPFTHSTNPYYYQQQSYNVNNIPELSLAYPNKTTPMFDQSTNTNINTNNDVNINPNQIRNKKTSFNVGTRYNTNNNNNIPISSQYNINTTNTLNNNFNSINNFANNYNTALDSPYKKKELSNPNLSKYGDFNRLNKPLNQDGSKDLDTERNNTKIMAPYVTIKQNLNLAGHENNKKLLSTIIGKNSAPIYTKTQKGSASPSKNVIVDHYEYFRNKASEKRQEALERQKQTNNISDGKSKEKQTIIYHDPNYILKKDNSDISKPLTGYNSYKTGIYNSRLESQTINNTNQNYLNEKEKVQARLRQSIYLGEVKEDESKKANTIDNITNLTNNSNANNTNSNKTKKNTGFTFNHDKYKDVKISIPSTNEPNSRIHNHSNTNNANNNTNKSRYDESTVLTQQGGALSMIKERNLQLKNEDFVNFMKEKKSLTKNEKNIKDIITRMIDNHISKKISEIDKAEKSHNKDKNNESNEKIYEMNIISHDNKEGFDIDFSIIEDFYYDKYNEYYNLMPTVNYYLVENNSEIREYLKIKISEVNKRFKVLFKQQKIPFMFNMKIIEHDISEIEFDFDYNFNKKNTDTEECYFNSNTVDNNNNKDVNINIDSKSLWINKQSQFYVKNKFDIVILNRSTDRIISSGNTIEEFLSKSLYLLVSEGELAFFTEQLESKLMVREYYNTSLRHSSTMGEMYERADYYEKLLNNKNILSNSKEVSSGIIWDTITRNEKFLSTKNYMIGVKQINDYLDVTNCLRTNKEGVHLMSKMINKRLIKIEEINRVKRILEGLSNYDNKEDMYFIYEKLTGFFFKKNDMKEKSNDEDFDFDLPKGVERLHIIEKVIDYKNYGNEGKTGYSRNTGVDDYEHGVKEVKKMIVKKEFYFKNGKKEIIESFS